MSNRDVVDAQEDKSAGSKDDDVDARFAGYVESNNNNNNLDFEHELEFNMSTLIGCIWEVTTRPGDI